MVERWVAAACAVLTVGSCLLSSRPAMAGQRPSQKAPMKTVSPDKPALDSPDEQLSRKIDKYVAQVMSALKIPGLSLAVVRDGKVVKAKGYGLANLELDVPAKPETVYLLASVTKQFTAAGIMMLVEDGKVELDAPISRYLSDTPESWAGITVRHLLTHTGGLRHRFEGKEAKDWLLDFPTEAMYKAARETPVDFKPGERWSYSDQGYFLLGMIVEKVSGKSYRAFMTERVFKPLGMDATTTDNQTEIVKNIASGYALQGGRPVHNRRSAAYGVVSHFGILSTVLDLAKWDAALYGEKLLKRASLEQMWTPVTLNSGLNANSGSGSYGFGWFVDEFFGHKVVEHGGSTGTSIWRLPTDRVTVIVLTNLEQISGGDAGGIAKTIARMAVPGYRWSVQKPQPDPDAALSEKLKAEVLRIAEGKPDVSLYTPAFGAAVTVATQQSKGFYAGIGPLKSFAYLGERPAGRSRKLYYRADYRDVPLFYTIALTPDGKIANFVGEPEFEERP